MNLKYRKNNFIGIIFKVFYIIVLKLKKKKKKIAIFEGLCVSQNNKTLTLTNVVKKEKISFMFNLDSPYIFKLIEISAYKRVVYRVSKIYFKLNSTYLSDFNVDLMSNLSNFKMDFFFSAYLKKKVVKKKKKIKKFKRKYTHTENWKSLKIDINSI